MRLPAARTSPAHLLGEVKKFAPDAYKGGDNKIIITGIALSIGRER
jgi:hypothetical protein